MNNVLALGATCALVLVLAVPGDAQSIATNDDGSPAASSLTVGGPNTLVPGRMTTTFIGGNGFAGNMFDMTTTVDLTISSIDINSNAPVGSHVDVDVWYTVGTCVGNQMNAAVWTLLGSYNGVSAGFGAPTAIDMTGNGMNWLAGVSYGIYVDVTSYAFTGGIAYTNGVGSSGTVYSNADMTLETWYGCRNTDVLGPFTQTIFEIRDWNGTIHYDTAVSGPVYSIIGLVGGGTATLTVTNATPLGGVLLGYSLTGAGPTNTPLGMVDMSVPIVTLPPLTADAAGVATMSTAVPVQATGFTIYTQGADLVSGVLTNSLAEVVL
jgi:hypothetical protein